MKNKDNSKLDYLSKDLKKLALNSLIILVIIVALSIIDHQTDFLLKASQYFMENFVG